MVRALLLAAVLGGIVTAPSMARAASIAPSAAAPTADCARVGRPFDPRGLAVPSVKGRVGVLASGHDQRGVPIPPPLTTTGKWEFAWDKVVRSGSSHGVVRLTAHTYPAFAGLALGNRLLSTLKVGAMVRAYGPRRQQLCYRVIRRMSVPASHTVASYYADSGPPRLAILVCSGVRRGPGDWSRRTVWFAKPVALTSTASTRAGEVLLPGLS